MRGNSVDIGFLQDMRVHHENAVTIANTYLTHRPGRRAPARTSNPTLRLIANEIAPVSSRRPGG